MQILSKLQRNSSYYIYLKLFFLTVVVLLNSSFIFMPLLLGSVIFCEDLIIISLYIALFSIFHNLNLFESVYIFFIAVFFKLFLHKKILEYVNTTYQPIVSIIFIYFFLLAIFKLNNFILIYILYNIAFDIVLVRIFKCEPT